MHLSNKCYTENNGDAAASQVLSADRATAVKSALIGMGIDVGRIEAEGYGNAIRCAHRRMLPTLGGASFEFGITP